MKKKVIPKSGYTAVRMSHRGHPNRSKTGKTDYSFE